MARAPCGGKDQAAHHAGARSASGSTWDIFVPHDQAEARVAAALAAGGHLVSDEHAPEWWALADAEGNEVDVATWARRD